MIAYCGLNCKNCDAFIATKNNDDEMRKRVAAEWSTLYNAPITPEHINCTGCRTEGIKTYYCEHMCEVRKCAIEKNFSTCADCSDMPCEKLNEIFKFSEAARDNLNELKRK